PGGADAGRAAAAGLTRATVAAPTPAAAPISRAALCRAPPPLPAGPAILPRLLRQPRQPKLRGAGQSRSAALTRRTPGGYPPEVTATCPSGPLGTSGRPRFPGRRRPLASGCRVKVGEADRARRDRCGRPNVLATPRAARHHRDTPCLPAYRRRRSHQRNA